MAVNSVLAPYPSFFDAAGDPLENGFIYIGAAGFEARSTPKASFFDVAQTIPTGTASGSAIRTKAGFPVNTSNSPAMFYVDGDFSISVCDRNGVLLYSALNMTLALNVGAAVGPVLWADGNLGAVGGGFANESNTGFVRPSAGIMQSVVGGVLVSQQSATGTVFAQPVSGAGFTSAVAAIAQPLDADLTALAGVASNGILARTGAGTATARTLTAGSGVQITDGDGVAGNPTISAAWTYTSPVTLSGSSNDWTGLPAGLTEIRLFIEIASLTGTNSYLVRLGTSGGLIATGYNGTTATIDGTSAATTAFTTEFLLFAGVAADGFSGFVTFAKGDSNKWFVSAVNVRGGTKMTFTSGFVDLGAALTQLRFGASGANTFDNGLAYIAYR